MSDVTTPAAEVLLTAGGPAILIPEGEQEPDAWRLRDGRLDVLTAEGVVATLDLGGEAAARAALDRQGEIACVRIDDGGPVQDWTLPRLA